MPPQAKFTAWPQDHGPIRSPAEIHAAYQRGWQGCIPNPAAEEKLRDLIRQTSGFKSLADAAHANGWADSAKGKLVVPFLAIRHFWPHAFPGEAQQTGCCVSMSTRNALLCTLACELLAGLPDPDTGKIEGKPDVPADGERTGVLSNAPIYWLRGYNGDGWDCATAASVAVHKMGCVVAKEYPELGIDLTHCNAHNDHLYGSRPPGEEIMAALSGHRAASAAEINSFEELRDALANGYGVTTCGGEGWSSTRNEDGVSQRSGSWSHAMACLGADDREITKKKYGEPLIWIQNSWANWNKGPLRILGTKLDANAGGFWTTWSSAKRRYMAALSNIAGWPAQKMPDWGAHLVFH